MRGLSQESAPTAWIDIQFGAAYGCRVKRNSRKKTAAVEHIVQLAKQVKWEDVKLPSGEVVTAETIREIFADAEQSLKPKRARKRSHALVS